MNYSREAYRFLMTTAIRCGYRFRDFLEEQAGERTIYLRHDVDFSPMMALELARINADLGVKGTFSLLLRCPVYNALSHNALARAREIAALGQRLALHYALPPTLPEDDDELGEMVVLDFRMLASELPQMQPVFAWHNGTALIDGGRGLRVHAKGLVNVYSSRFVKDIPYYSDTNMRYSVWQFEQIIAKQDHPVIHLLFHPLNWVAGGANMIEVLATTWAYIVRESEEEMRVNRVYGHRFPDGMPVSVLDRMSSAIVDAGSRAGGGSVR